LISSLQANLPGTFPLIYATETAKTTTAKTTTVKTTTVKTTAAKATKITKTTEIFALTEMMTATTHRVRLLAEITDGTAVMMIVVMTVAEAIVVSIVDTIDVEAIVEEDTTIVVITIVVTTTVATTIVVDGAIEIDETIVAEATTAGKTILHVVDKDPLWNVMSALKN